MLLYTAALKPSTTIGTLSPAERDHVVRAIVLGTNFLASGLDIAISQAELLANLF